MGDNQETRPMMRNAAFAPNGLMRGEARSLAQEFSPDTWTEAEKRTTVLLNQLLPNKQSEDVRNSVVSYLKRLVMNSVPCQLFTFGSVPLKTYLPDGDIDLTAFCDNPELRDSLVHEVRRVLEREMMNENAEFPVTEVNYIDAEVTILKCMVGNFVVDISFNQISGLCTLCFLEEIDNLIGHDHLFKRSIILIKAWCFHESHILGAQHGLMSTYALEVLVLYIFHIYDNTFPLGGPLEVLFRFLDFFSKFDWKTYGISLCGPFKLNSLPNVTAVPPVSDSEGLLLNDEFLDAATKNYYGVKRRNQENQPLIRKHMNIVDPLCQNNNLGRSISFGSFKRIQSAITLGIHRIKRLLDCPKEKITPEFDYFFKHTWDAHGHGHWLDLSVYNLFVRDGDIPENPTQNEFQVEQAQPSLSLNNNPMPEASASSASSSNIRNEHDDRGKGPMYPPSNEVQAMPTCVIHPSNEVYAMQNQHSFGQTSNAFGFGENNGFGLPANEGMMRLMNHQECDLFFLTNTYRNQLLNAYLQTSPPIIVNVSNLHLPPPLPAVFIPPPPPPPPFGFPLPPLPPGFEQARPFGVPPMNASSPVFPWSYYIPYSQGLPPVPRPFQYNFVPGYLDHGNINESFWFAQHTDGASSSNSPAFQASSSTNHLPTLYWDTTQLRWVTRENESDRDTPVRRVNDRDLGLPSSSRNSQLVDTTRHSAQNITGITTSNVHVNQSAGHWQGPMAAPISSWFSPGTSMRVDNQGSSLFAPGPSRPPFQPTTSFPFNNLPMDMNPDLINPQMNMYPGQQSRMLNPFPLPIPDEPSQPDLVRQDETSQPDLVREGQVIDIMKADFDFHWMNLQYGRYCENLQVQQQVSLPHQPPVVLPPLYYPPQPAHSPRDVAPRRPPDSVNMTHGPPLSSSTPIQLPQAFPAYPNSQNVDWTQDYRRSGTGTFLPDPISYQNRYARRRSNWNTRNEEGYNRWERERNQYRWERERERNQYHDDDYNYSRESRGRNRSHDDYNYSRERNRSHDDYNYSRERRERRERNRSHEDYNYSGERNRYHDDYNHSGDRFSRNSHYFQYGDCGPGTRRRDWSRRDAIEITPRFHNISDPMVLDNNLAPRNVRRGRGFLGPHAAASHEGESSRSALYNLINVGNSSAYPSPIQTSNPHSPGTRNQDDVPILNDANFPPLV